MERLRHPLAGSDAVTLARFGAASRAVSMLGLKPITKLLHYTWANALYCLVGGHVGSGLGHKSVGAAPLGRVSPAVRHNG